MSTISDLIFKNQEHYITSPFGKRTVLNTVNGKTSTFHYGCDYGTNGKKIAQYAISDGFISSCGVASDGALYVWIEYPKLNVKLLHYHLSKISVVKNQKIKKGDLLGYTGATGKATGIHLHLGVKYLNTENYIDPELYSKEYDYNLNFIGGDDMTKGYFKKGDKNEGVYTLKTLLRLLYYKKIIKSKVDDNNIFGDGTEKAVKEVQTISKITVDGCAGKKTISAIYNLLK